MGASHPQAFTLPDFSLCNVYLPRQEQDAVQAVEPQDDDGEGIDTEAVADIQDHLGSLDQFCGFLFAHTFGLNSLDFCFSRTTGHDVSMQMSTTEAASLEGRPSSPTGVIIATPEGIDGNAVETQVAIQEHMSSSEVDASVFSQLLQNVLSGSFDLEDASVMRTLQHRLARSSSQFLNEHLNGSGSLAAAISQSFSNVDHSFSSFAVSGTLRLPSQIRLESAELIANSNAEPGTPASNGTMLPFNAWSAIQQVSRCRGVRELLDGCRHVLRPSCMLRSLSGTAPRSCARASAISEETHSTVVEMERADLRQIALPPDEACAICLATFQVGEIVQPMVGCNHLFHESCVAAFQEEPSGARFLQYQPMWERVKCSLCQVQLATPSDSDIPLQERYSVVSLEVGFDAALADPEVHEVDDDTLSRRNSSQESISLAVAARNLGAGQSSNLACGIRRNHMTEFQGSSGAGTIGAHEHVRPCDHSGAELFASLLALDAPDNGMSSFSGLDFAGHAPVQENSSGEAMAHNLVAGPTAHSATSINFDWTTELEGGTGNLEEAPYDIQSDLELDASPFSQPWRSIFSESFDFEGASVNDVPQYGNADAGHQFLNEPLSSSGWLGAGVLQSPSNEDHSDAHVRGSRALQLPSHTIADTAEFEADPNSEPGTPASDRTILDGHVWWAEPGSEAWRRRRDAMEPVEHLRYVLRPPCVVCTSSDMAQGSCAGNSSAMPVTLLTPAATERADLRQIGLPPDEACAICLETFQVGDIVQPMVGCSHLFHESCVAALLEARREEVHALQFQHLGERVKCPLCRGQLATPSLSDVPPQERNSVVSLESFLREPVVDFEAHHGDDRNVSRRHSSQESINLAVAARNLGGRHTDTRTHNLGADQTVVPDGNDGEVDVSDRAREEYFREIDAVGALILARGLARTLTDNSTHDIFPHRTLAMEDNHDEVNVPAPTQEIPDLVADSQNVQATMVQEYHHELEDFFRFLLSGSDVPPEQ